MKKATKKITALYCRSAVKDNNSIQNQQNKLKTYVVGQNIANYEFYIDNGFSGSSLERPELKRLLSDMKNGKIAEVIVVSEAALSRNIVQSSLLNQTFEENGIGCFVLGKSSLEKWYEQEVAKDPKIHDFLVAISQ